MISIDILPMPTHEAIRETENRLLGLETNITNWQRKQNQTNNFSAVVSYDMEQQRKETREMLDDLTARDQRLFFAVITLAHLADSKEQLDADTESILTMARNRLCQASILSWKQMDGLSTALPYGVRKIDALRTLTTESTAAIVPFQAQELSHSRGIYYGQNQISKNLFMIDRRSLLNRNGLVLGVSGAGKSFTAKREIMSVALSTDDDIVIIDPEREYGRLVEALGGQVIDVSAASSNHINALDMAQGYGDGNENPVVLKSQFVLSLFEQLFGNQELGLKERSILDRCVNRIYQPYLKRHMSGNPPTLKTLHRELLK